jgi:D-3-phosphoglycerate dehydrogenase
VTVLIADKFEQSGVDGLRALGCDVVHEPALEGDALRDAVQRSGAQVLVVRSTRVSEAVMDAGQLSLIVRAGAGVNTIDVAAASRRGIYVSNCPGKNAVAVAVPSACPSSSGAAASRQTRVRAWRRSNSSASRSRPRPQR